MIITPDHPDAHRVIVRDSLNKRIGMICFVDTEACIARGYALDDNQKVVVDANGTPRIIEYHNIKTEMLCCN